MYSLFVSNSNSTISCSHVLPTFLVETFQLKSFPLSLILYIETRIHLHREKDRENEHWTYVGNHPARIFAIECGFCPFKMWLFSFVVSVTIAIRMHPSKTLFPIRLLLQFVWIITGNETVCILHFYDTIVSSLQQVLSSIPHIEFSIFEKTTSLQWFCGLMRRSINLRKSFSPSTDLRCWKILEIFFNNADIYLSPWLDLQQIQRDTKLNWSIENNWMLNKKQTDSLEWQRHTHIRSVRTHKKYTNEWKKAHRIDRDKNKEKCQEPRKMQRTIYWTVFNCRYVFRCKRTWQKKWQTMWTRDKDRATKKKKRRRE